MTKVYTVTLLVILILLISSDVYAQHQPGLERGDPRVRAKQQMEGNQVRTTVFNHGQTGRTGGEFPITEQTPYEWPKNTGKVYLALTGIFVGGQVTDRNGQTQRIIDVMNYRQSPDGRSWNFEPTPGYYNPDKQQVATSVDPTTWPPFWPDKLTAESDPGWPGSWNGYFGKNIFNADQEIFFRASDDRYDRYAAYFPDDTDESRKGLGIVLDVRTLAWSQILVQDVVYILHTIKNDGDKDIPKVGVTIWFADFVGGDGDSQDDISEYDLIEDILWARDLDGRSSAPAFGSDPVGIVGVSFLETPGNALDRIDNDGDGEIGGPKITGPNNIGFVNLLDGEIPDNFIDDNGNGLVDENETHVPFDIQEGVTYADGIDQNGNAETGSPVVTAEMVSLVQNDRWKRWPLMDAFQENIVHLIMVESDDIDKAYKDNIDNNGNGEEGSPVVTQAMIDLASNDAPYYRYKVPGSSIILYDLKQEDLGKKYADGIDNDGNRAIDENIDEGIDEMIDEARDNGIDDDGDWDPFLDDVGLDGVPDTFDEGEGDGKPTSGAGTDLPGEPNIDVTDVSETDQIGITNAQKVAAGGLNINSDAVMWFDFMIPGKFFAPFPVVVGEYDLFVSSSFFPLKAGQTEPFSIAVILANAPLPDPNGQQRKQEVLKKRIRAQETYDNDYRFANAPITPTVTAIAGDNRVTLYWDDVAESSFDSYINGIGGNGNDFEGYRIYRSSDPAFEDAKFITDANGVPTFMKPLVIFDLVDGIKGLDSVGFNGIHYDLGNDSGLRHSWIDSTVQNGFTYYYAVVSYDFGYPLGRIIPIESPIRITVNADGSYTSSRNVVRITPEAPAAGYIPPTLNEIILVNGSTTGAVNYEIVDINMIQDNHVYYITFEDTLKVGVPPVPDTLTTKNFSLIDSTSNVILIDKSRNIGAGYEQPLTDGFRLNFTNESRVELNKSESRWNDSILPPFVFEKFLLPVTGVGLVKGQENPSDYFVIFGNVGFGTSTRIQLGTSIFPSKQVNFQVYNRTTKSFIEFGFIELDSTAHGGPGELSARGSFKDRIVFLERNAQDSLVYTWWFYLDKEPNTAIGQSIPQNGDTATINLRKPFLKQDIFRFVASAQKIDLNKAKEDLEKIKVVPNPYLASADWEPKNPYQSGRGPRSLHFTHLPNKCTIRIFTINGELVDVIEHESAFSDGTAYWDMLSKDNLSISYGVYVFHVEAPGVGEKIGKFAVIK